MSTEGEVDFEKVMAKKREEWEEDGWRDFPLSPNSGIIKKSVRVMVYTENVEMNIKSKMLEKQIPRAEYPELWKEIDRLAYIAEPQDVPPLAPRPKGPTRYPPLAPTPLRTDPPIAKRNGKPTPAVGALARTEVAKAIDPAVAEIVLGTGNLEGLTSEQRVNYYTAVCDSIGLNPLTRPFDFITFTRNNKKSTILYAKRDATDQLRSLHNISISIVSREEINDIYIVTARATDPSGRTDESTGAKSLISSWQGQSQKLTGDQLANAYMTAESKAKRRATLSICGLGWLDETEVQTIPEAEESNG